MQFLNTDFLQDGEIKLVTDRLSEGDPERNWVPAYHFHICDLQGSIMGACDLRIGYTEGLYWRSYRVLHQRRIPGPSLCCKGLQTSVLSGSHAWDELFVHHLQSR